MRTSAALATLALMSIQTAAARPITLAGLTFSDELGGVVLHDGWGNGTAAEPFVLVEEIRDDGPEILVVRGMRSRLGDAPDARFQLGFVLRKIVTNATGRPWHVFELELREQLEHTSSYEDGLSFGQATHQLRPFTADRFASVRMQDEPYDAVVFSDGLVEPGDQVSVTAAITDYTPLDAFFLLQRRESPIAALVRQPPG
ncbi:MAG: hypothetical protein AB7O95_29780 [Geminicoccaceae bacterium]